MYIAQVTQASNPSPTSNKPPFYTDPAFMVSLLSIFIVAVMGLIMRRVNNKLTLVDNYRKELNAKEAELNNCQVKIMVEAENLDLKKAIIDTNTNVSNLSQAVTQLAEKVDTIADNMATKDDIEKLENRITNLTKGMPE